MKKTFALLMIITCCLLASVNAIASTPIPYNLIFGMGKSDVIKTMRDEGIEPTSEYYIQRNGITSKRIKLIEFDNAKIFWFENIALIAYFIDDLLLDISFELPADETDPNNQIIEALKNYFDESEYIDMKNNSWLYSFSGDMVSCSYGHLMKIPYDGENYTEHMQTSIMFEDHSRYMELLTVFNEEFN